MTSQINNECLSKLTRTIYEYLVTNLDCRSFEYELVPGRSGERSAKEIEHQHLKASSGIKDKIETSRSDGGFPRRLISVVSTIGADYHPATKVSTTPTMTEPYTIRFE